MAIEPREYIAIITADPNVRRSLAEAVAKFRSAADVLLVIDDSDWERLDRNRVAWAFIDATLINKQRAVILRRFGHVVLFCFEQAKTLRSFWRPSPDQRTGLPVMETEPYALTADLLIERYGRDISDLPSHIDPSFRPHRVSSERRCSTAQASRVATIGGQDLTAFLDYVQGVIHHSANLLQQNFVSQSGVREIAKYQLALNKQPASVSDAERALRKHLSSGSDLRPFFLLIGKSGAGKTTLGYYAGRTEEACKNVCFLPIDFTLIQSSEILRGDLLALTKAFCENVDLAKREIDLSAIPQHAWSTRITPLLARIVAENAYDQVKDVPEHVQQLLLSQCDRRFLTEMYCHFRHGGERPEIVRFKYPSYHSLIADAERWYGELSYDVRRLLVYYLYFVLSIKSVEEFESFVFRQLLADRMNVPDVFPALEKSAEATDASQDVFHAVRNQDRPQLIDACYKMSPTQLQSFVLKFIELVAGGRRLFVLMDNIDQRPSAELEARVIIGAAGLFDREFLSRYPSARCCLSMRDTTYQKQNWVRMPMDDWQKVELRSPNLIAVLSKRCDSWRRRGAFVGHGETYRFIVDICDLVKTWKDEKLQRNDSDTSDHSLLELIEARHPYNVGEQLQAFTSCCRNSLLHRAFVESSIARDESDIEPGWLLKSRQFFVRVFLMGEQPFFHEDSNTIPNVFDAQSPDEPFNPWMRLWIMNCVRPEELFSFSGIIERFHGTSISDDDIESTITDLIRFHIFRRQPGKLSQLILSEWGEYFRRNIALDLPYIGTVWWSTPMQEGYDLGAPRVPLATDLRQLAGVFLRWLRFERDLALSRLREHFCGKLTDRLFADISYNVTYSLHRIEQSLSLRVAGKPNSISNE